MSSKANEYDIPQPGQRFNLGDVLERRYVVDSDYVKHRKMQRTVELVQIFLPDPRRLRESTEGLGPTQAEALRRRMTTYRVKVLGERMEEARSRSSVVSEHTLRNHYRRTKRSPGAGRWEYAIDLTEVGDEHRELATTESLYDPRPFLSIEEVRESAFYEPGRRVYRRWVPAPTEWALDPEFLQMQMRGEA